MGCLEMSVRISHYSQRNNPEERSSQMVTVHFPIFTAFKIYNHNKTDVGGSFPGAKWLECNADATSLSFWIFRNFLNCALIIDPT